MNGKKPTKLDLDTVKIYHRKNDTAWILPLFEAAGTDPGRVFEIDHKRFKDADRVRYFTAGSRLVTAAYQLGETLQTAGLKEMAINCANFLLEHFAQPEGHFVEYERCPWLADDCLWYTIPWGTAFHGNDMVSMCQLIGQDLDAGEKARWQAALSNTGRWLYQNPIIGTYVFNCGIDLLRLLWRVGEELDDETWKTWSMQKAHDLIQRDIDPEGWIQAESGGVSGHYQLLGADFIARFAWESGDPLLAETTLRVFANHVRFATPTLLWNGNFGTRSNHLGGIGQRAHVLIAAALQDPVAGYLLKRHGHPSTSRDLDLWREALAAPEQEPVYESVDSFPGIESTVVREGPFQAWFCNYARSIWARGFTGLWIDGAGQAVFSTLHSLPAEVEKAKLRLGDTADWGGFPHVTVQGDACTFDSQQGMQDLHVTQEQGVCVTWQQDLLSAAGEVGGTMHSRCLFKDNVIHMTLSLGQLAGKARLDFHLLRKKDQYVTLWNAAQLDDIEQDRLLAQRQGLEIAFQAGEQEMVGVQINNTVYRFRLIDVPAGSEIAGGMLQNAGLHTGNHGGVRLRITLPEGLRDARVEIAFRR